MLNILCNIRSTAHPNLWRDSAVPSPNPPPEHFRGESVKFSPFHRSPNNLPFAFTSLWGTGFLACLLQLPSLYHSDPFFLFSSHFPRFSSNRPLPRLSPDSFSSRIFVRWSYLSDQSDIMAHTNGDKEPTKGRLAPSRPR